MLNNVGKHDGFIKEEIYHNEVFAKLKLLLCKLYVKFREDTLLFFLK
jgi:hypothetical protein